MKIGIINGPNLNLLGTREPEIYGSVSFDDYLKELRSEFSKIQFVYFQSNCEGEIVGMLQKFTHFDGIILNAAAYTHTSIAIRDAISAIESSVIEVHISNTHSREEFRKKSMIGSVCKGTISGFGLQSYKLATIYFNEKN